MDRFVNQAFRDLGQRLHSLLLAHIAGIERHDRTERKFQLLAQLARCWLDCRGVDPIGKEEPVRPGYALLRQARHHGRRDAADGIEGTEQPGFDCQGQAAQPPAGNDAEGKGGIDLEILDMEEGRRACEPGRETGPRHGN